MEGPIKKPDYVEAWDILQEVDERLRGEEDASGNLKDSGEARALNKMKRALTREIDKDASEFLKKRGFTSGGAKKVRR
jgi:hypothetical protein